MWEVLEMTVGDSIQSFEKASKYKTDKFMCLSKMSRHSL